MSNNVDKNIGVNSLEELRDAITRLEMINESYHRICTTIVDEEMANMSNLIMFPVKGEDEETLEEKEEETLEEFYARIKRQEEKRRDLAAYNRNKHNRRIASEYNLKDSKPNKPK